MARTVRTKVYKFNELSPEAKEKAIEEVRRRGIDTGYLYDEACETVKSFHEIFGTKEGRKSWLDIKTSHLDDNLMNLKGLRLRTYIVNNYWGDIHKGKYYSTPGHYDENNKYHYKFRHSKCTFERSCPLTGICWDMSILAPIYDFIDWKLRPDYNTYMDFETLMNDCLNSLEKDLENEVEYRNSDEAITEDIEAKDYEFTRNGKIFNQ